MLGFPVSYTRASLKKADKQPAWLLRQSRLRLLSLMWALPVLAWFLRNLLFPRNLCPEMTLDSMFQLFKPGHLNTLGGFLFRPPLCVPPLPCKDELAAKDLASPLGTLTGVRGFDSLVKGESVPNTAYQSLRAQVPPKLWQWKAVCNWTWRNRREHINLKELRALLGSIRWRLFRLIERRCRVVHLVDNLVVLHVVSRGRSSSRQMQRVLGRLNAYMLEPCSLKLANAMIMHCLSLDSILTCVSCSCLARLLRWMRCFPITLSICGQKAAQRDKQVIRWQPPRTPQPSLRHKLALSWRLMRA